jgi:hypothetical protein
MVFEMDFFLQVFRLNSLYSFMPYPMRSICLGRHYCVPWLRRLVADIWKRRLGLHPRPVYVGFMVDGVTLGHVSFPVVRQSWPFSSSIRLLFRTHSLCNIMSWTYKKNPPSPTDRVLRKMNIKFGLGYNNNKCIVLRNFYFEKITFLNVGTNMYSYIVFTLLFY